MTEQLLERAQLILRDIETLSRFIYELEARPEYDDLKKAKLVVRPHSCCCDDITVPDFLISIEEVLTKAKKELKLLQEKFEKL